MRKYVGHFLTLTLVFWCFTLSWAQQVPEKEWVKTWGGSEYDMIWESKPDGQGNTLSVGYFSDSVDFDPGVGVEMKFAGPNVRNGFIQKLDKDGDLVWVKTLSSLNRTEFYTVDIDPAGTITVAGSFDGDSLDVNFDSSQSDFIQGHPNNSTLFFLKLTSQGDLIWAKSQPGKARVMNMAVDGVGNIFMVGHFDGPFDGNPDPNVNNPLNPAVNGKFDVFIQKLNTLGDQQWIKTVTAGSDVWVHGLSTNTSGDVVAGGAFTGTVDFDPGAGVSTEINNNGSPQAYVLELDSSGNFQQVLRWEGTGGSRISDIFIDPLNNMYVAGSYENNVDFDPGSGVQGPVYTSQKSWFFEKFDANRRMEWVYPYANGRQFLSWFDVKLYVESDRLYVAGYFEQSDLDLEPGVPGGTVLTKSMGGRDIFVARHDTSGSLVWAQRFRSGAMERALSVFEDNSDDLYISGYYSGDISFDPYQLFPPSTSNNGLFDAFILKFSHCTPGVPDTSLMVQACRFYETSQGQRIYNDSLVVDTLLSAAGCDSLILNAQVEITPPLAVSANYGMIVWHHGAGTGTTRGHNLQWFNCDTQTLLPDTGYQFTPAQNGSYAVIIEKDGCIDTSGCVLVNDVGLPETHSQAGLSVYPNPTNGRISISGHREDIVKISVFDLRGRKLEEVKNQDFVKLDGLRSGAYVVRVELETGVTVRKVMRE